MNQIAELEAEIAKVKLMILENPLSIALNLNLKSLLKLRRQHCDAIRRLNKTLREQPKE